MLSLTRTWENSIFNGTKFLFLNFTKSHLILKSNLYFKGRKASLQMNLNNRGDLRYVTWRKKTVLLLIVV